MEARIWNLLVFAYLPGGSPGHLLFGLAVLAVRLLLLFAVSWSAGWLIFHFVSNSNRAGNAAFAAVVTLWFLDGLYMLLHHDGLLRGAVVATAG